jgi:chromosome segregation ATPase
MEAGASCSNHVLRNVDEAQSPHRILLPSLLRSRNKLRAKYRELRAECKRWRNQAAAVERSRSTWRERALRGEAAAQAEQTERVAIESQLQELRERSEEREAELAASRAELTAPVEAEKKGR